jgi:hypothetical protein
MEYPGSTVTVYPVSSTSPTLQAILQPHYQKRTRSIVLQPRTMTRSRFKSALTITTVDSYNLLVAGNLSRTLQSRSLVQPRGSPLLRRFGVRGLLRPLSASSTDPSQRACLTHLCEQCANPVALQDAEHGGIFNFWFRVCGTADCSGHD